MQPVHLDFETRSELDLKKVGVFAYAEHPSTDILCLAVQAPDAYVQVWFPGQPLPAILRTAEHFSAWNSTFEWVIWNMIGVRRYGFPPADRSRFDNPQARAMAINLPASLDGAASALKLDVHKDKVGQRLMRKMAKGQDITEENLKRLGDYCAQDVVVEAAVDRKIRLPLTGTEQRVYTLSERINRRGVQIDLEYVRLAAQAAAEYQQHVAEQMVRRYGFGPRQVQEIGAFCAKHRVPLPDLRADTVEAVLQLGELLPEPVVDVLQMRQKAAAAAPGKYAAMLRAVNSDGRLRGMFSYYGAGQTGRWSGRIVQLHNLARPTMDIDFALAYMEILRRAKTWKALGDDPLDVLLNTLRPSLIPGAAGVFTAGDESAIEARVLPWLAGEEGPLTVFRNGGDIYLHAAESIYHKPVTKADKAERQIGKVATLALGYAGGVGAFVTMGRGYGVHVPETEAEKIKVAWRIAHPRIEALWAVLEKMAIDALYEEGRVAPECQIGYIGKRVQTLPVAEVEAHVKSLGVQFKFKTSVLWLRLPSGRALAYPGARADFVTDDRFVQGYLDEGETEDEARRRARRRRIRFESPAGDQMVRESTYGGKIAENLTQAVARDVLAHAMLLIEDEPIVMHVHDEAVAEGDCVKSMELALTTVPDWARGLPLAAEVSTLERYWK